MSAPTDAMDLPTMRARRAEAAVTDACCDLLTITSLVGAVADPAHRQDLVTKLGTALAQASARLPEVARG